MKLLLGVLLVVLLVVGVWLWLPRGLSARDEPSAVEAFVARRLRLLSIPREARTLKNPLPPGGEVVREGMEHFADHCAICHANDGSGQTDIGENVYPKAPDLAGKDTQSLSDGELFYIIRNGIRFTAMPAFGSGDPSADKETWEFVSFIRHLPDVTEEELATMERRNPKSATAAEAAAGADPDDSRHEGHAH